MEDVASLKELSLILLSEGIKLKYDVLENGRPSLTIRNGTTELNVQHSSQGCYELAYTRYRDAQDRHPDTAKKTFLPEPFSLDQVAERIYDFIQPRDLQALAAQLPAGVRGEYSFESKSGPGFRIQNGDSFLSILPLPNGQYRANQWIEKKTGETFGLDYRQGDIFAIRDMVIEFTRPTSLTTLFHNLETAINGLPKTDKRQVYQAEGESFLVIAGKDGQGLTVEKYGINGQFRVASTRIKNPVMCPNAAHAQRAALRLIAQL